MMNWKKIAAFGLAAVMTAALVAGCGGQQAAKDGAGSGDKGKIIVGLDDNFPPMGFKDENNEIVGFDVDLAKEASKRLGREVEFKAIDWSSKEAELKSGRVNVLWNGLDITEKIKVRNFNIVSVYEGVMDGTDNIVVLADMADLQRLDGWSSDEASVLELTLAPGAKTDAGMRAVTDEVGHIATALADEDDDILIATSVISRYPQIFDWLNLIDFNVLFILVLMTIVAGFNMISGLLIMLFRNISTIGTLKSLGMTDKSIAKVFLRVASVIVFKGMLAGNAVALLLCGIQKWTHVLKLNPENYFVPYVPVSVNLPAVLAADLLSWLVIMLLLLIPCLFISKVDPAQTVRTQ